MRADFASPRNNAVRHATKSNRLLPAMSQSTRSDGSLVDDHDRRPTVCAPLCTETAITELHNLLPCRQMIYLFNVIYRPQLQ